MSRAISIAELYTMRHHSMPFDGAWADALGMPERTGSWIIWGNSANGKTRFAVKLCKYLAQFGRVAYNSIEEGASLSLKRAFMDEGMDDVRRNVILLDKEPISELVERLKRHKSPDIVFIDSIQHAGLSYREYVELKDSFRKKLFVLVSHADGKHPEGRVAKSIRYDAFIKIWVEGFRAFPQGRYGGGDPFTIWPEKAAIYWNENQN